MDPEIILMERTPERKVLGFANRRRPGRVSPGMEPPPTVLSALLALAALALVLGGLERFRPSVRPARLFGRERLVDVLYYFLGTYVTGPVVAAAAGLAVLGVAVAFGLPREAAQLTAWLRERSPLSRQPRLLQTAEILLLSDFLSYWAHRAFHQGRLWRFHAVHHSATHLDWLSGLRGHPLNDAAMRVASAVPVFFLGFDHSHLPKLLLPVIGLWAVGIHANVRWTFGPLRWVVSTPLFHRWHHTSELEGRDRNFAGLFPLWDLVFGTFYMPAGRVPEAFGTDTPVPRNVLAALAFPFRRSS
jgi:sterol desaturase/sphingolipid hydroxylase (fatty acid hydroxylase superfamily)